MTIDAATYPHMAWGIDLTAANYSGGAGGTFTDLVSAEQDWQVVSATPTFTTKYGVEGMTFSALAAESVLAQNPSPGDITVVALVSPAAGTLMYPWGGNSGGSNSHGIRTYSGTAGAFIANADSGWTSGHPTIVRPQPIVMAGTFSTRNQTTYATVYDGSGFYDSSAVGTAVPQQQYFENAIGRYRTTYFNGWIGSVYGFHAPLHLTDRSGLEAIMLEMYSRMS